MTAPYPSEEMKEVFIHFLENAGDQVEQVIQIITGIHGHVTHVYPPHVIIALIPQHAFKSLTEHAGIASVYDGLISEERLQQVAPDIQQVMLNWNDHLKGQQHIGEQAKTTPPLSWDAPGYLPPDPPTHVQEQLRRHQQELQAEQTKKETRGES
jgi:hypothetical protein